MGGGSITWGSVADWFAAVGTVGALLMTVFIVMSDRQARRRESADRVLGRIGSAGTGDAWDITFFIYNSGTMPVTSVVLFGPDLGIRAEEPEDFPDAWHFEEVAPTASEMQSAWLAPRTLTSDARFPGLHAGESRYVHIHQSVKPDLTEFYYAFFDGSGKMWARNAMTGRYVPRRKAMALAVHAQRESG